MSRIVIIEGQGQGEDGEPISNGSEPKATKGQGETQEPEPPYVPMPPAREAPPWGAVFALIGVVAILGGLIFFLASTTIPTGTAAKPAKKEATAGICLKGDDEEGCFCPKDSKGKSVKGKACVKMERVASGTFLMGPDIDAVRRDTPELYEEFADALPRHGVTFQEDFWVSKFEITFDQWDACFFGRDKTNVDAEGNPIGCMTQPYDEGWGRGDRPVINVSWNQAQEYLRWLSRQTGKNIRLLTEAEWEYMARGGDEAPSQHIPYAFTDDLGTLIQYNPVAEPSAFHANYQPRHVQDEERACEYRRRTVPQYFTETPNIADQLSDCSRIKGSRQIFFPYINNANPLGIHFVHGNVWEWVQDCYVAGYQGGPFDGSARELEEQEDGVECPKRVLRGGSWGSASHAIRVDYRNNRSPNLKSNAVGFRIAWTDGDCIVAGCDKKKRSLFNFSRGRSKASSAASSASSDDDDEAWED